MRAPLLPAALLGSVLAIATLSDSATAQIVLQPGYGLGVRPLWAGSVRIVNPSTLYDGATVVTPRSYLSTAPTGPYPTSPPCATPQIRTPFTAAPPPSSGTFRPPIRPDYSAFRDRFAAPAQPNTSHPVTSGCP